MLIDDDKKVISVKIVFFGPAMSGKTTAIRWLFSALGIPEKLSCIENTLGRTMFFDFGTITMPLGVEWTINAQMWSATGQEYYQSTRQTVLAGTDGIVFVADSQRALMDENLRAWNELKKMLASGGERITIVVCLNKQDLPDATNEQHLRTCLDIPVSIPVYKIVATSGQGVAEAVHDVLHASVRQILR